MASGTDRARAAALALIDGVIGARRTLAELTAPGGVLDPLRPEERARAQRLALTVLRNRDRADAVLKPMLRRPPPGPVRDVLRLGVVEMLEESIPPHGAVNAAVALLRANPKTAHLSGLANAVLRRAGAYSPTDWQALPPQRLPGWLRGRLDSAYGRAVVSAIEAAHQSPPPLDLTPRDGDAAALAARVGGQVLATGSVRYASGGAVSGLSGYDDGAFWVQDAAAALPARLLAAGGADLAGQSVLDLCAAPGGKTLQLATMGARVTALDVSEPRIGRLRDNLARTGLAATLVVADALTWRPEQAFDAVLLDAPCSATGTIRRHPDLPVVRDGKGLKTLFALQADLLARAVDFLRPGGRLVYCTCSLLPQEGPDQIAALLAKRDDIARLDSALDGVPADWSDAPGSYATRPDYWSADGGMDGFFMAALQKLG